MNLQSNFHSSKYNRIVTQPEKGITVVEPLYVAPVSKDKLIYSDYNPHSRTWTATLSPSQRRKLSDTVLAHLRINTALPNLTVSSRLGILSVGFCINPQLLGAGRIAPFAHTGLQVLLINEGSINFSWDLSRSDAKWPEWLTPYQ